MGWKGDLSWILLILCAAAGSLCGGDNIAHWIERKVGEPAADRIFRDENGQARLQWTERAAQGHDSHLVVVSRFIPDARGRTARDAMQEALRARRPRRDLGSGAATR